MFSRLYIQHSVLCERICDLISTQLALSVDNWAPYYADSNDAARLRDVGKFMTRGNCGEAGIGIRRESQDFQLKVKRVRVASSDLSIIWLGIKVLPAGGSHDLPGETFRLLSKEVAYLKLCSVKAAEAAHYLEAAADTKGLIIDIRNYPSEFVVFALGSLLVDKPTEFVRFTIGDLSNPGAFHWGQPLSLSP